MKKRRYLNILTGLLLIFTSNVQAQVDFLLMEDGNGNVGSSNNSINVILANENELGGLQFTLVYDFNLLSVDTITTLNRLLDMALYFNETEPGNLTVLVTDFSGQTILPGDGTIITIEMTVLPDASPQATTLNLGEVVLSNTNGQTIPVSWVDGYFIITGTDILRMENGYERETADTVSVDLYNELTIGAVQFTLNYNSTLFLVDTILATPRSDIMILEYNEPQPGETIVLLYSLTGDSITFGTGSILNFVFNVIKSSSSTVTLLQLNDIVITSPSGVVIEYESINGNFIVKNYPPAVVNPLLDAIIAEDTPPQTIVNLDTIFDDPDDDILIFTVISNNSNVHPFIVNDNQLKILLSENWSGEAEIVVTANDGVLTIQDTMQLIVTQVNDPPATFHLVSPQNESIITDTLVTFQWTDAVDPENDDVMYSLYIYIGTDTTKFENLTDNLITLHVQSYLENQISYFWHVQASDGLLNRESQETFSFLTDYLVTVLSTDQLPHEYQLLQNYPNPFNATTIIRYNLPQRTNITIMIYDLLGRKVRTLVKDSKNAGYLSVFWDGNNDDGYPVPGGIYFYRFFARSFSKAEDSLQGSEQDFTQTRKMVLLR